VHVSVIDFQYPVARLNTQLVSKRKPINRGHYDALFLRCAIG
jgi:hypothetical protein